VLFCHPKDFTPVCTTELGYMARIKPEFDRRGVKVVGLSVDPTDKHAQWASDIEKSQGHAPNSQRGHARQLEGRRRRDHLGIGLQ
jgi:alkyl hydroperoxide reductase subunit AhpC